MSLILNTAKPSLPSVVEKKLNDSHLRPIIYSDFVRLGDDKPGFISFLFGDSYGPYRGLIFLTDGERGCGPVWNRDLKPILMGATSLPKLEKISLSMIEATVVCKDGIYYFGLMYDKEVGVQITLPQEEPLPRLPF